MPPSTLSSTPATKLLSVGGQKQCGGGDLFRAAQPVERYRRGELCLVGLTVQHRSVDRARAQRVEPDAAVVELSGPGAGIGPQRGLSGAVGAVTANADIACGRADQNDRAAGADPR